MTLPDELILSNAASVSRRAWGWTTITRQINASMEAGKAPMPKNMSVRTMLVTTGRTRAPISDVRGQISSRPPPISTRATILP
ncbi:hypothetical protein [Candidatus Palauibacter sp.]|uniref:hypothetical protein n=1 Tax=Candidatus Palauibacter sp. TaxID=3101350 RepID=UPI003CC61E0E